MSADLQWLLIRKNNSFLLRGNGQTFSREANNLKNRHSQRYNGLVNRKSIGVEASPDNKGVVLVTKNAKNSRRPAKSMARVELKRGSRRSLATIRKVIKNNKYRKDLKMLALRRASAILSSQKPVVIRKARSAPKKKE